MAKITLKRIDSDYQFQTLDESGKVMTMDIHED